MTKLFACATGLAILAGSAAVGSAAIVFRDDFEAFSVGAGTFPQAEVDLDPTASIGNWYLSESGGANNVQVTKDFSPVQGVQALGLGRYGQGGHFLGAEFTPSPATQSDPLSIRFKFSDPSPDSMFTGTVDRFELLGYNKTGGGFGSQVFDIILTTGWYSATTLTANFGSTSLDPNSSLRADWTGLNFDTGWVDVEILMNFVAHTYTLSINGVAVANSTNIAFNGDAATANSMQQMVFYTYNSSDSVHAIDDVTVEVIPEPAAVSLLGLGALAMIRRRA